MRFGDYARSQILHKCWNVEGYYDVRRRNGSDSTRKEILGAVRVLRENILLVVIDFEGLGNMKNAYFVSEQNDFDLDGRKYRRAIDEMCNLHYYRLGRSHVHLIKCVTGNQRTYMYANVNEKRRHCTRSYEPRDDRVWDEMLHDEYWKTLRWKDPCLSAAERQEFGLCDFKCDAPEHRRKGKESYCTRPAWHDLSSSRTSGTSQIDGHYFLCLHFVTTKNFHHVFVLNSSASVRGDPWTELATAVQAYLNNRITYRASQDLVSIVTFGNRGIVECDSLNITRANSIAIPYQGGGSTL